MSSGGRVRIGGEEWSARSHEIRDLLSRNVIPFGFYRGCRIALYDSVSTPNTRPEHGWMSESGNQIMGGMCRTSDLTKPLGKLRDSL